MRLEKNATVTVRGIRDDCEPMLSTVLLHSHAELLVRIPPSCILQFDPNTLISVGGAFKIDPPA